MDHQEDRDHVEREDHKEVLEPMVVLVQSVWQEPVDHVVFVVPRDQMAVPVDQDLRACRENKDPLDPLVFVEPLVTMVLKVLRDVMEAVVKMDPPDQMETKDHVVFQDFQEHQAV